MQVVLRMAFVIAAFSLAPSSFCQVGDFFPLGIEHSWIYSYKATEDEYWGFLLVKRTVDSGFVQYIVQDSIRSDTALGWLVQEKDSILRRISDYYYGTDTLFLISNQSSFQLLEAIDSAHTLNAESHFPPFIFPVRWPAAVGSAINRYGDDKPFLDRVEVYYPYPLVVSDSLRFEKDIGLTWAQSSIDKGPNTLYHNSWQASLLSFTTSALIAVTSHPETFVLFQNYPNPFNPSTIISFNLPQRSFVELAIYDILGRRIKTLAQEAMDPGTHKIFWADPNLVSGIYFCVLKADDHIKTTKLIMAR